MTPKVLSASRSYTLQQLCESPHPNVPSAHCPHGRKSLTKYFPGSFLARGHLRGPEQWESLCSLTQQAEKENLPCPQSAVLPAPCFSAATPPQPQKVPTGRRKGRSRRSVDAHRGSQCRSQTAWFTPERKAKGKEGNLSVTTDSTAHIRCVPSLGEAEGREVGSGLHCTAAPRGERTASAWLQYGRWDGMASSSCCALIAQDGV